MKISRHALAPIFLLGVVACLTRPAAAQITRADFHESEDLPDFGSLGPRLLQNLNVALPSPGPQLTDANQITNPSGWADQLNVSFDPTTNILSLVANAPDAYQTITVTLSNLQFALPNLQIIGITPISTGNAVTLGEGSSPFAVLTSFTGNSFTVDYAVPLGGENFFEINPVADTFQVTVGPVSAAPEPGTLAFVATALGAVGVLRRRRQVKEGNPT